jgi:hypothetical protein
MKKTLPISEKSLIRISCILVILITGLFTGLTCQADIWEPEGLNMPGGWNGWQNPPTDNLALASYTQVTGGRVVKFSTGIHRWQTIFSVAASGGDIFGGSYSWLFTSGPSGSPWGNKWSNVNVTMNTLQSYTKEGASNNTIEVTNGKWYTMNFEDAGYADTRAIFMETSGQPVDIASVSVPSAVAPGDPAVITVTLSQAPSVEELFYLRYSADGWATSSVVTVAMGGTSGTAQIPGQSAGATVSYYAFSSTIDLITADYDLLTIKLNSNGGTNYSYIVTNPNPEITFANLQWPPVGLCNPGQEFNVFGRAEIPGITGQTTPAPGLSAWIGYSTVNTDPSTWTDWLVAAYQGPFWVYDEFMANLGAAISATGTYYYATRFSLNSGGYLYGGYSASGGGFWDGISNISGVLTVVSPPVPTFRVLENITVNAKESVCYDATQTITVGGNGSYFNVMNFGEVTLVAGQNIILLPGTSVAEGGYLRGYITENSQYCPPVAAPVKSAGISSVNPLPSGTFSFRIFPNPASAEVTVDLQGVAAEVQSRLELFGIRGNRISAQTIEGPGNYSFSVADLPTGVYCVRIISGDQVQTRMVVKQ